MPDNDLGILGNINLCDLHNKGGRVINPILWIKKLRQREEPCPRLQDKLNFNPGNLTPGLVPLPPIPKCLIKVSYYSYFKKTEKGGEKRGREEKTEGKYRSSFFIIFSC